jgi:hypothetical protein
VRPRAIVIAALLASVASSAAAAQEASDSASRRPGALGRPSGTSGARPRAAGLRSAGWGPQESRSLWEVRVGHAYSSAQALRQPATFVVIAESERATLTALDVGVLATGPLGTRGGLEAGGRLSGGSARPRARRVYGGLVRAWRHFAPVVVALAGEYEADGGFDVTKGVLGVEATVTGGAPGLGVPLSPRVPLRWRPWLGLGYGNVLKTDVAAREVEEGGFVRAYARLEVSLAPGRSELGLEATVWLVEGDARRTQYLKGALAIPVAGGFSVVASGEAGRRPPRFAYVRRLGVGVGFRR